MILLVGFYLDDDAGRTGEFVECVRRNCENKYIEQIIVFIEYGASAAELIACWPLFGHGKIRIIEHRQRLTFAHLFAFANRHLAGSVVAIANGDIFFDETLQLLDDIALKGRMFCLSRWDESPGGDPQHYDNPCSQDAWIFEAPVPKIKADFFLGVPGCDNRVAYEAELAGLAVTNPSRSVRARHLHQSVVRRYNDGDRLYGPHLLVPASFLDVASPLFVRPPESDFPSHRGRNAEHQVDNRLQEIMMLLAPHMDGFVPRALRLELRRTVCQRTNVSSRPDEVPLATVSFCEPMGYTIERLNPGISTHNNDIRQLIYVPDKLRGLCFTQVVANHAAPVEIQFQSKGKLFVLAAPGWEGYKIAASFLDDAGWREPIDVLRTQDGTIFEAWSLVADAGEQLVIPTQVMLAAEQLIRLEACQFPDKTDVNLLSSYS